ncbi:uncharacterized protein LOC117111836 [Anneissia japonica]|uniref:uncharacterized protein LOC117111836 n=1 Tax=Anneissia japonica TaxID=1529436 RepID=UPI001425AD03|nr:uncharacterized protein LOC117111836 [Anneissia japonica]
MPSSGAVNFMQSYLCDLETACIPGNSSTIESNAVPSYAGASVSQVFDTLEPILSNENVTDSLNDISGSIDTLMGLANALEAGINITDIDYRVGDLFKNESHVAWFLENVIELDPDVVDAFLNSSININQLLELTGYVDFYRITCNETELMKYLSFPYGSDPRQISKELCRINVTSIPAIIGEFQEQLNIEYLLLQFARFTSAVSGNDWYDWIAAIEDAINVLENLDAFPELQVFIKEASASYDMLIAVRDVMKVVEDIQSGEFEVNYETMMRSVTLMDRWFGDEGWWLDLKDSVMSMLDFVYENEEKRNTTELEDLFRENRLKTILEEHFGEAHHVLQAFMNASINLHSLLELIEKDGSWLTSQSFCNGSLSLTDFLEFDPKVNVTWIQQDFCRANVTQFWQDLISGMDAVLIAKETKEYLSNMEDGLDWGIILRSLFNFTERSDLPEIFGVDLKSMKSMMDDDIVQTFIEILFTNKSTHDWFKEQSLNGSWTTGLNSSFYQIDPEFVYNLNSIIVNLNDMINVLREQLSDACPEVDSDTVETCETECETHKECATGRICCPNGCGTSCIDEESPELRKFIDGVFGLLDELSFLQKNGSLTSDDLNRIMREIVSLRFDAFVCNSSAIVAAFGPSASADLATDLNTICDVNITTLLLEASREFNVEHFIMTIENLFLEMPSNYSGERISFEEFVHGCEMLVGNLLIYPEILTEIESRYNLTLNELLDLILVYTVPEYDPTNMMSMFNIEELIAIFIGNHTSLYYATLRNLHYNNYMTSLQIKFIRMLYGLEIRIPTLEGILVNATETRKLIKVTYIVPEVADLLLSLTMDPAKMVTFLSTPFPFHHLCETGNFSSYFALSDLSTTNVHAVEQQLCAIDVSLIITELAEIVNLDEIMHQIFLMMNTSIVPPPYNLTETLLIQEQSNAAYAELFSNPPRITLDEEWLETTQAKLTTVAENWLEEISTNALDTEQMAGQLTMLFSNESWYKEFHNYLSVAVHVNTVLNQQLVKLNGTTIDLPKLESLFVDESEIRDFLELADILPEIIDVFLSLTISSDKFIELLMMEEPFTVICEEGDFSVYFTLPSESMTDLGEVEQAICSINLTALQDQLLHVFGITDEINEDEDLAALFATALELSETIQQLVKNPSKFDVDMVWLETTLTELSSVYEQWITRLTQQEDMQNMQKDLESLQSLLNALMELDDWEAIERALVVTQQIIAYLDGEIQDLPGRNLTFDDIFPPATAEYLEIIFDLSPEIIALQLGTEINTEAFMALLENEDPLKEICSDVAVIESLVVDVVEGVNLTELQIALCSQNLTLLEKEWTDLLATYHKLLEAHSAFNLTESIVVISNFVNSLTTLFENPAKFEMYSEEWYIHQLNATLHLLAGLQNRYSLEDLSKTETNLDMLSFFLDESTTALINESLHTALRIQEMYLSGEISLIDIANYTEEYFEDAGLREHVQPYIEIYNLILESIIKETHEQGRILLDLFNSSVPLETLYKQMDVPVGELEATLLTQFVSIYELAHIYNYGMWNDVFCDPENFRLTLIFNDIEPFNITAVQQSMCKMNTTAFFIHASNAHNIDVLALVAQIDRIIYPSEKTPLEDSEWEDVLERTIEVVELLSWLSNVYSMPGDDDYTDILARLMALQNEQNSQNMKDLLKIIEDVLPYLNDDYSWIKESIGSAEHTMNLITHYQNIR